MSDTVTVFSLGCVALLIASGCSQLRNSPSEPEAQNSTAMAESTETKDRVKLGSPITTIKPGAGVIVDATTTDTLQAGENGATFVSIFEPYSEGTLLLTSTGSEGLSVFGAETTAQIDMSLEGPHEVRLDYSADIDGVYYINMVATTIFIDGREDSRAHAIRVEVGDWQNTSEASRSSDTEVSPDGEAMVIMDAEETIE
ncbi:MAG: hypothetical protein AAGG45_07285 [Pseudomonadota bacterium]